MDYGESLVEIYDAFERVFSGGLKKCDFADYQAEIHPFGNYFIKNRAFEEEKEYRICYIPVNADKDTLPPKKFRVGADGRIIPFMDFSIAGDGDALPVQDIVLGPRNVNETGSILELFSFESGDRKPTVTKSTATYRR